MPRVELRPGHVGHRLGFWIAYGVLPLFGLANAGLAFDTLPPGAMRDRLALGVVLLAARLGLARLLEGVTWTQLYGGAVRHRLHHEPVHRRPGFPADAAGGMR